MFKRIGGYISNIPNELKLKANDIKANYKSNKLYALQFILLCLLFFVGLIINVKYLFKYWNATIDWGILFNDVYKSEFSMALFIVSAIFIVLWLIIFIIRGYIEYKLIDKIINTMFLIPFLFLIIVCGYAFYYYFSFGKDAFYDYFNQYSQYSKPVVLFLLFIVIMFFVNFLRNQESNNTKLLFFDMFLIFISVPIVLYIKSISLVILLFIATTFSFLVFVGIMVWFEDVFKDDSDYNFSKGTKIYEKNGNLYFKDSYGKRHNLTKNGKIVTYDDLIKNNVKIKVDDKTIHFDKVRHREKFLGIF